LEDTGARSINYIGGHWRKVYSKPHDLTRLIPEAIRAEDLMSAQASENVMVEKLMESLSSMPPEVQGIVWLKIVWGTLRDEEVIDPLLLGDAGFQRTVMRLAHESDPPLFVYEQPKTPIATASILRISQGNMNEWRGGRDLVILELMTNGLLSILLNISGTKLDKDAIDSFLSLTCSFLIRPWHRNDFPVHGPSQPPGGNTMTPISVMICYYIVWHYTM